MGRELFLKMLGRSGSSCRAVATVRRMSKATRMICAAQKVLSHEPSQVVRALQDPGRYNFKVLAVNSLDFNESPSKEFEPVELSPLALSPYQQKYTATGVVLDAPRPVSWILSAKTSSSFAASKDGRTKLKDSANISHNSKNVQTNLVLHSSAAKVAASVTYSVNLTLVPLSQHIRTLAATIDSLERQRKAVQGEDGQEELDDDLDNRLEEWNHFRGKAWELKKRKKAKKAENSHQRRLTFVTLGNTGTGKSELCRWMTMDDPHLGP